LLQETLTLLCLCELALARSFIYLWSRLIGAHGPRSAWTGVAPERVENSSLAGASTADYEGRPRSANGVALGQRLVEWRHIADRLRDHLGYAHVCLLLRLVEFLPLRSTRFDAQLTFDAPVDGLAG
jgi:hypothetical protein